MIIYGLEFMNMIINPWLSETKQSSALESDFEVM